MRNWSETSRRDFDTAASDQQLGLFAADSQGYTGADLFSDQEEAAAADTGEIKTGDYVVRGLEAPARVIEVGAGWVELRREAGASYRIETMHVRKVSNARQIHLERLQAVRDGSPAVQDGPYAYLRDDA